MAVNGYLALVHFPDGDKIVNVLETPLENQPLDGFGVAEGWIVERVSVRPGESELDHTFEIWVRATGLSA